MCKINLSIFKTCQLSCYLFLIALKRQKFRKFESKLWFQINFSVLIHALTWSCFLPILGNGKKRKLTLFLWGEGIGCPPPLESVLLELEQLKDSFGKLSKIMGGIIFTQNAKKCHQKWNVCSVSEKLIISLMRNLRLLFSNASYEAGI